MDTRPLILWSGGLDSTALLIECLHKGHDVDVLYVNIDNNKKSQKRERVAITKLRALINDAAFKGKIIDELTFGYHTVQVSHNLHFPQPAMWLFAAAFMVNPRVHSSIEVAYVKYDDVWHVKHEVVTTFNNLWSLTHSEGTPIPLSFPYEWNTKEDAAKLIVNRHPLACQVLNVIWYCEEEFKQPCGKCPSCIRHHNEVGDLNELFLTKSRAPTA